MKTPQFNIRTCESIAGGETSCVLPNNRFDRTTTFPISDPFDLRKAILPVFRREPNGRIFGMGTAFHVDGWGGCLTADHVIDFIRGTNAPSTKTLELSPLDAPHAVLFLGIGLCLGTTRIPSWAFAPLTDFRSFASEKDDPLATIRGNSTLRISADISGVQALLTNNQEIPKTLPVNARWQPTIGEYVLAIGFPELNPSSELDDESIVAEEMHGSLGRITGIHPNGRSASNPTPVFEVEANWQSGMSGGPVFNCTGEVVGIVSRSISPDGDTPGVGYATYLGLAGLDVLMPSLDIGNSCWRFGYGVLNKNKWHLAGVYRTAVEAREVATNLGNQYRVTRGSHRIGSDDFIATTPL